MPPPSAVALRVLVPTWSPSVHAPIAAMPPASVTTGFVPLTLPLPAVTANVTLTPGTLLLNASPTITAGGVKTGVPAPAVWLLPRSMAMGVAGPAPPRPRGRLGVGAPPAGAHPAR